jgi:hypothetical protein
MPLLVYAAGCRSALLEEVQRLEGAIAAEQQLLEQQQKQATAAAGSSEQQPDDVDGAGAAAAGGGAVDEAGDGATAAAGGDGVDSLDAFMEDVTEKMELDKVSCGTTRACADVTMVHVLGCCCLVRDHEN